jgi:ABC-type nitrate/sulfonate/bicarbonate transport system ATPase subunit
MISIRDLAVKYQSKSGALLALSHLNLMIPTGSICAVIGPSGCGKSTLLKIVAGIIQDYCGEVTLNGRLIDPRRDTIGFIPQNYGLLPWANVENNISLGLKIKEPHKKVNPASVREIMQHLKLTGLEKRYPRELSGGQQQRVGLARSFLLRPDILLMDEPFSALDAMTREEMQDVFLTLWQETAITTILVTHYVEEAVYLGQHIVVLSDGPGHVDTLIENPLFGGKNIRQTPEFFSMSLKLHNLIQKGWRQQ